MTGDRSSIIILFLFLSENHIHVIWHWVESLINFFCTSFWSPFLFLGVFWLRVIFVGSLASLEVTMKNLLGLWRQIITSEFFGTILSLSCQRNSLERWTVFSEKLFQIRIIYWGDVLDGLDDFYTWVCKSSSFLKKEIYVLLAWRSDKCLSMQAVVGYRSPRFWTFSLSFSLEPS